jgi:glycosyltransferase involved in cell wall biosynthesis
MRVLLHADVDLSWPGGVETHVRRIAFELERRGHEVEIAARPAILPPFRMVSRVDPDRYDVIHHHLGLLPREFARRPGCVQTIHLCNAAKMETYLRMGRLRTLLNPINYRELRTEREACRSRRRLIVVGERVKRDLARWHGLDPARARVISNGVSFEPPTEQRESLRARYGVPAEAPVLLTIGRHDYVKGFGLLERAWRRSSAPRRDAVWVNVGGRAPERERDRVTTGPVPHQEVVSWIHAADFGASPSYYEGCSVALLEMLAGRLWSLAHDVGTAREVIVDGENGAIVPRSDDAWIEALERALARPRSRNAIALGREFSWENVAARIESVYLERPVEDPRPNAAVGAR